MEEVVSVPSSEKNIILIDMMQRAIQEWKDAIEENNRINNQLEIMIDNMESQLANLEYGDD
jgi:hypothetical protein